MLRALLLIFCLYSVPLLAANRVRCSWLIGAVAYLNSAGSMMEMPVIGGAPKNDEELLAMLSEILGPTVEIFRFEQPGRVVPGDERVDRAMAVLGGIKARGPGPIARESDIPRQFVADPTKPKAEDDERVNARAEIVQRRLQIALQNILKAEAPTTILAPPIIVRDQAVYEIVHCLIHDPEVGVASYQKVPGLRMQSGALKVALSLVTMTPFIYLGVKRSIPLPTAATGIAVGSAPLWMGLWDGMRASYEFVRDRFAADNIDVFGFEQFAIRADLNRAKPGQVFWLHGKEKGPWELDLVIFIQPDGRPVFLTLITRDIK